MASTRLSWILRVAAILTLLFGGRFVADWLRFPVDGYEGLRPADVVEYLTFYAVLFAGLCLFFLKQALRPRSASHCALFVLAVYMYLHFSEYFLDMGGRAAVYPPKERFLSNLASAFVATGDAGFWQIMRIFLCGGIMIAIVLRRGGSLPRLVWSLTVFYVVAMLLVHPDLWMINPPGDEGFTVASIAAGQYTYTTSSYSAVLLAVLTWALLPDRCRMVRLVSKAEVFGWITAFLACLSVLPLFLPDESRGRYLGVALCWTSCYLAAQALVSKPVDQRPQSVDRWSLSLVSAVAALGISSWIVAGLLSLTAATMPIGVALSILGSAEHRHPWARGSMRGVVASALVYLGAFASVAA